MPTFSAALSAPVCTQNCALPLANTGSASVTPASQRGGCRAIASNNRAPALKLLDSLQRGVSISMPGFAATWLYFSHPRRDAHFCSKAALAAFALFIATLNNAAMLLDLLSYYGAWRRKGFHAIIVVRAPRSYLELSVTVVLRTSSRQTRALSRAVP